ncbi:MAG TPA: hypothetical protein VFW07_28405 [Parafilimonas sp.]|nr:hypothetical protein [Parafilimonas sp.]
MKFFIFFIGLVFFIYGCSKNALQTSDQLLTSITEEPQNIAPNGPTPPGYGGSSAVGLGVYKSGTHYQTSFAGGLTFTSFPYPLNVPTTGGVILFTPAYEGLGGTNILSVYQNGPYISITISALGTSLAISNALIDYHTKVNDYLTGAKDPKTGKLKQETRPNPPVSLNSNGYLTFDGTFIIDPSIPITHVSIATGFIKQTAAVE